ncbi:DUF4232 domain-containing protein [Streptomyces althioticus]|uniref:DUF4232 domain-containing protein n=1 Tax=Streptomyces althioticus TaxID=83380 RepID=UPI003830F4D7
MRTAVRRARRARSTWKPYAVGAAVAAALLATTACEGDSDEGGPVPPSASVSQSQSQATPPAPDDDASEAPTDGDDAVGTDLCTMKDLTFTASKYGERGEPARHIMVVATNGSDKECEIQNAPEIMLGDAQGPAPVMEGTEADEPFTLAPGEKAYAGVLATGGNRDTYEVTFMTLTLGSPGGEAEAEEPVELEMPTEGSFQADDGQRVTGWQPTEGLAMRPVTQS